MFGYQLDEKPNVNKVMKSHHKIEDVLLDIIGFNLSLREGVFFMVFLLFTILLSIAAQKRNIQRIRRSIGLGDDMLTFDKRMPSYFEALNLVDLQEIVEEEIVLNEDFHSRTMAKAVF